MVDGAGGRDLQCMWWLALLVFVSEVLGAHEVVGCFKSLPSSFSDPVYNAHQSTGLCLDTCKEKQTLYFALHDHTDCYCGNEDPTSQETSGSCDAYCYGISTEMCGGKDAFSVFRLTDGDAPSQGILSASAGKGGASASSKSSTSSSATNTINSGGTATTTSSPTTVAPDATERGPSVVIVTSIKTISGQLTTISTEEGRPNSSNAASSGSRHNGKKVNVGTVVGAAMGALVGLILALLLLIFILRHIAAKREQERMEKEYQEAIKPIDYDEALYMPKYVGSNSLQESKSSTVINPFDDNRRVSNGSIVNETIEPNSNVLTVVNPDQ